MKTNLRKLQSDDWKYFAKWWRDEELIDLTSGDHSVLSDAKIQKQTQAMINDKKSHHWMIDAEQKTVGHINLNKITPKKAEMQIVIGEKDYWGKGIGSEAATQVLNEAKILGFKTIYVEARPTNLRAINFYQKLGFKNLGLKNYPNNPNLPKVVMMEKENVGT